MADQESVYAHLLQGIEKYSKFGDIMIQGHLNAYTNTNGDFILNDHSGQNFD